MFYRILFVISISIATIQSANILFLLAVPSASHRLWNNVLIEKLTANGHNLTVLTVEYENSQANVTYIHVEKIYEALSVHHNVWLDFETKSPFKLITKHYQMYNSISKHIFQSNGVRVLANYPASFQFHAIIHDCTMAQSLLAFVEHFNNPPLISVSPLNMPSLSTLSATHIYPSYMTHYTMNAQLQANIIDRFLNMLYHCYDWFYRRYIFMRNENQRTTQLFPNNQHKLEQMEKSDLVLINSDFSYHDPFPLPPNVVRVGGLQAERINEIPNDNVITFVKNSQKPIILFTLGSNIPTSDFGRSEMNHLIGAFRQLSEFNFVCKSEIEFMNLPTNVLLVNWFQQNELLKNSKVVLIMTTGGLLTMQEALIHRKLVLGMPLKFDQHRNIAKAISYGFADAIDVHNYTKAEVCFKIRNLIANPKYQQHLQQHWELTQTSPTAASQIAIYWIEQVLKHNGLKHLKVASSKLSFYKLYLLDIISVIFIILLAYTLIMQYHLIKQYVSRKEQQPIDEDERFKSD
ncbi:unnamed protein product [Diamesa serratosioi]